MATVKFAHIGMNNLVQTNRVLTVIPPRTRTAERILEVAKGHGQFIDASRGRSHRSLLIMDDYTVIASCISPMTLLRRFSLEPDQFPTDFRSDDTEDLLEFDEEEELE